MIDILTEGSATGEYFYVSVEGTYTVIYLGTFDGATVSLEIQAEDAADNIEPITVPNSSKTEGFVGRIHLDPTIPVRAAIENAGASTSVSVILT